jgi:PEGA domain
VCILSILLAGCLGDSLAPGPDPIRSLVGPNVPKSLTGVIDITSDPPGARATASIGDVSCQTPCSLELTSEGPFTLTFTRDGYLPSTVTVQIQPAEHGISDPKFTPNPAFAQLAPVPAPTAERRKKKKQAAR